MSADIQCRIMVWVHISDFLRDFRLLHINPTTRIFPNRILQFYEQIWTEKLLLRNCVEIFPSFPHYKEVIGGPGLPVTYQEITTSWQIYPVLSYNYKKSLQIGHIWNHTSALSDVFEAFPKHGDEWTAVMRSRMDKTVFAV